MMNHNKHLRISKSATTDFKEFANDIFLQRLHIFFSDKKPIVFAAGTAPMTKKRSEIKEIFFATNFSKAYFADPMYKVPQVLTWEQEALRTFAEIKKMQENTIHFIVNNVIRSITFLPVDATIPETMPKKFSVFFSGKRVGLYPGFPLRGTPSDYLVEIVKNLPKGGFLIPDRDLTDDTIYFPITPQELGLHEIFRVKPQGYILGEDILFSKNKGLALYKKI